MSWVTNFCGLKMLFSKKKSDHMMIMIQQDYVKLPVALTLMLRTIIIDENAHNPKEYEILNRPKIFRLKSWKNWCQSVFLIENRIYQKNWYLFSIIIVHNTNLYLYRKEQYRDIFGIESDVKVYFPLMIACNSTYPFYLTF